jgi:ribosome recycling factor
VLGYSRGLDISIKFAHITQERRRMKILSCKEFAERLGVSAVRARQLCAAGRVKGAEKKAHDWIIPAGAKDPRRKVKCAK